MDHITKKNRNENIAVISKSENSTKETNRETQKSKSPTISSKRLDIMLENTHEKLKQENAWKNDNLSKDAQDSVIKTAQLNQSKTSTSQTNKAKRLAFSESEEITSEQRAKFGDILEVIPKAVLSEITDVKHFSEVNSSELYEVLFEEKAFSIFKNTDEGNRFAANLLSTINTKIKEMEPGDKGLALVLRFPSCYNNISHIALASVWRDEDGKLKLSICHQESIVPHTKISANGDKQKVDTYTGIIYDTLDTSKEYPNNIAPVIESMKLCGPPSMLVFPCPYPENLQKYTAIMKNTIFDYGAADPWRISDDKKISKNLPFQTCFNVTQRSLAVLYGFPINYKPTLAGNFEEISLFSGSKEKISSRYVIGKNEFISSEEMKNLIADAKKNPESRNKRYENIIGMGFVQVGENWIDPQLADVKGMTETKKGRITIQPGSTTFDIPKGVSNFKFITENKLLENLEFNDPNNKIVVKDKVYNVDDVAKIRLKNSSPKPITFDYVYTVKINKAKL